MCCRKRCFREEPLPSFRFAKCHLPRRWRPWQKGQVSSLFVNGQKKSAVKLQTFRPCQSLSLSGEVARRSRDGEGCFRDEPSQSRCARQLSRRESPWQRGQVSSLFVNGRKKPAVKLQTFRPCQSLSLSGEVARRSRDGEGLLLLPNFFQNFLLSVQETSPLLRVRIQRGTQSTRKASLASLCPQPYRKEAVQA